VAQRIAVTGSVDQHGRIQAIGGINEKIEGFFELCRERGLTGDQGVLIPTANLPHLMLETDVAQAVREGAFHVWAITTVDEGIELLTGMTSGVAGPDGAFPEETFHGRVQARIAAFAELAREFPSTAAAPLG
jgi:predicted ATP-dependent protease